MKKTAYQLAAFLEDLPRDEQDIAIAKLLRRQADLCEVAVEVVNARTHEQSKAAYAELIDIVKGRRD